MIGLQFIYGFFGAAGFALICNVPRRHIIAASLAGASGWATLSLALSVGYGSIAAYFFGACVVALLSDIFSRFFKEASTVFIIPGILPMVPGAGMYNTMLAFLEGDLEKMSQVGSETLLIAGAISVAIMVLMSLIKVSVTIKRSIFPRRNSNARS